MTTLLFGVRAKLVGGMCLAALVLAVVPASALAQQNPLAEKRRAFLEKRGTGVHAVAHPLTKLQRQEFKITGVLDGSGQVRQGHFCVEVVYHWEFENKNYTTTLWFFHDQKGMLNELRVKNCTALFQPFVVSDLGLAVLKATLKGNPNVANNQQLLDLIDRAPNSRQLVQNILAFDQRLGLD